MKQFLPRFLLALILLVPAQTRARSQRTAGSTEEWTLKIGGGSTSAQQSLVRYADIIERHAATYGIDPDWIRAIMIVEARRPADEMENRIPPTNIDAVEWARLENLNRDQFMDVPTTIRLCALLLRRIFDRLPGGSKSLRFVATLYDDLGGKSVSNYGLLVERAHVERWWEEKR